MSDRAPIIAIGDRVGPWTVLDPLPLIRSANALWYARCVCGREEAITGHRLTSPKPRPCRACTAPPPKPVLAPKPPKAVMRVPVIACRPPPLARACGLRAQRKPRPEAPFGAVYGQWTVIDAAPRPHGGGERWLCRCSCGRERVMVASSIVSGESTQCKVCKPPRPPGMPPIPMVIGATYGKWTVFGDGSPVGARPRLWLCRCTCGITKAVAVGNLRNGKSRGCRACAGKAKRRGRNCDDTPRCPWRHWPQSSASARRRPSPCRVGVTSR
jgi:hypothetical protein